MKRTAIILSLFFMVIGLDAKVNLTYEDPESFTDFEFSHTRETIDTDYFTKKIIRYLDRALEKKFPEGTVLSINFSNIDLAGRFEPWQDVPLDDVRIFKFNYPPAAEFTYRLEDSNGIVLAEGEASIRKLGFQDGGSRRSSSIDLYYYERRMLESWINRELVKEAESSKN